MINLELYIWESWKNFSLENVIEKEIEKHQKHSPFGKVEYFEDKIAQNIQHKIKQHKYFENEMYIKLHYLKHTKVLRLKGEITEWGLRFNKADIQRFIHDFIHLLACKLTFEIIENKEY